MGGNSVPDLTGASPIAIGSGLQMFHGPLENLVHKLLEAVEVVVVVKHDSEGFKPPPTLDQTGPPVQAPAAPSL